MRLLGRLAVWTGLTLFAAAAMAQQQINPNTQIRWPANCYTSPIVTYNQQANTCFTPGALTFLGTWSNATTYASNAVVYYAGNSYVSLINGNLNHQPDVSPIQWQLLVTGSQTVSSSVTINTANGMVVADSTAYSTAYGMLLVGDSNTGTQPGVQPAGCGGAATPACWPNLLAVDYNIPQSAVNNWATGGAKMLDITAQLLTHANPQDSANPIVFGMGGGNDALSVVSPAPTPALLVYQKANMAAVTWGALSISNKVLASAGTVTKTGAWTTDSSFSNAIGEQSSTVGNSLTYGSALVGTTGIFCVKHRMNGTDGTFHVTVDGVTGTDLITNATTISGAWTADPANFVTVSAGDACYQTTNGSHSIAVIVDSGNVGIFAFEFPSISRMRGASGPRYVMGGVVQVGDGSNAVNLGLFNTASIVVEQNAVKWGMDVPFADAHSIDNVRDFTASSVQGCTGSTGYPNHFNSCGNLDFRNLVEAAINGSLANALINPPIQTVAQSAATNLLGFTIFQPHGYADGLIAGIVDGVGNASGGLLSPLPYGIKTHVDGTLGPGHLVMVDQAVHFNGFGHANNSNPTADSQFTVDFWVKQNGSGQMVANGQCFQSTTDTTPVCSLDNLVGYGQTSQSCSTSCSISVSTLNHITLTGNAAISFAPLLPAGATTQVVICQDGTGGRVATVSSTVKNFPTLLLAANTAPGACISVNAVADTTAGAVVFSSPAVVLFSAAGTALPACAVGTKGLQLVVSDATAPTYMGAYTSGGAITAEVICSFNGTTYSWLTH